MVVMHELQRRRRNKPIISCQLTAFIVLGEYLMSSPHELSRWVLQPSVVSLRPIVVRTSSCCL